MNFLDSTSYREVTLTYADAVDPLLAVPPSQRTLGPAEDLELSKGSVRLRVGDRPIVRNLKRLFVKAGKTLPPDLDVFAAYNIWLVAFGIGILRESGFGAVQRLGFSVTFPDKPRFTVIELLPQTKFVKKFGSHVKIETALGLNGSARVPEVVSQVVAQTDVLSADASLCLSAAADLVGTLSFSVFTPTVETIGIGSRRAEWAFETSERPLLGDQHMFVTLLAPKSVDELEAMIHFSATISTFSLLPCKLEKSVSLQVPLE